MSYHRTCYKTGIDNKATCGIPKYKVDFCEDITDGSKCVNGPDGDGVPYSNKIKPVDGKAGKIFPHQNYLCNWDDKNKKCYLDTTCPCDCWQGEFDLDESSTGAIECSDLKTQEVCELFYKKSGFEAFSCRPTDNAQLHKTFSERSIWFATLM